MGTIAQLVQQQRQSDEIDESEFSDEIIPVDNGSTKLKGQAQDTDEEEIDYEEDQFTDTQGALEMQKVKGKDTAQIKMLK